MNNDFNIEKISNQKDFIHFLSYLEKDLQNNLDNWENINLESFLQGMKGYISDSKYSDASWKIFAEILLAATVYE